MLRHGEKLSPVFISVHSNQISFNESTKPIRIIKTRQGKYFEVRSTPCALFSTELGEVAELRNAKSDIEWENDFKLTIPKIPSEILRDVFREFRASFPNECLINICFDSEKKEYYLVIPQQYSTPDSVEYYKSDDLVVMEIHSHAGLDAYFSKTDDADELATGFYGVIGKVDTQIPQLRVRYSCGGRYKEFDPKKLFEQEA